MVPGRVLLDLTKRTLVAAVGGFHGALHAARCAGLAKCPLVGVRAVPLLALLVGGYPAEGGRARWLSSRSLMVRKVTAERRA